jgi:hypothetical protein
VLAEDRATVGTTRERWPGDGILPSQRYVSQRMEGLVPYIIYKEKHTI